jgi:hypothetical protein
MDKHPVAVKLLIGQETAKSGGAHDHHQVVRRKS